ncbi:PP0621 family protein [Piscinibacter sp.]|uniref:PP0621 family protein n=1 Tax=Piscinibacter sp. TaxID=1903157 RepID=UPI002B8E117F|nr:PP0621 family protein [Albitalea sp.]HUG24602.1 PP0621 family protein [Albitalea sp.]
MKYLVLILIVVVVLWLARASRRVPPPSAPRGGAQPPKKEAMLECAQCGLHLPRGEALPGRGGVFCSDAHRADYEKAHPPT